MTNRASESEHLQMIEHLRSALEQEGGTDIRMAHKSFSPPFCIRSLAGNPYHNPDVSAQINGTIWLYEVETADSITDEHTVDEWGSFARYCESRNSTFCIVVPAGFGRDAQAHAAKLRLIAEVGEISPDGFFLLGKEGEPFEFGLAWEMRYAIDGHDERQDEM